MSALVVFLTMAYLTGTKKKSSDGNTEEIPLVTSSFLQSAKYDPKSFSLTITFKNGTEFIHQDIDSAVWQQFKESPSKGSYYANIIKKKYPSVGFKPGLKVSELTAAIKENRPNAPIKSKARR